MRTRSVKKGTAPATRSRKDAAPRTRPEDQARVEKVASELVGPVRHTMGRALHGESLVGARR